MIYDLYRNEKPPNFKLEILKSYETNEEEDYFQYEYEEEEEYEHNQCDDFFQYFYSKINKLECNQNTEEDLSICLKDLDKIQKKLQVQINHTYKPSPEQFILLFHAIYALHYPKIEGLPSDSISISLFAFSNQYIKKLLFDYIILIDTLINNYPDLINSFLDSAELDNYIKIFSGIFLGWDVTLISAILSKSDNAASILLSKGLLYLIFNSMQSTKTIIQEQSPYSKIIIDYWTHAITLLEKIVISYNADKLVIKSILDYCIQYLSIDFELNISSGFVNKVIDCISACIQRICDLDKFDIQYFVPFLMSLLDSKDTRYRIRILKLFNTISAPPICFQWDLSIILTISEYFLQWYNEKNSIHVDNKTRQKSICKFFKLLSNVIQNQPEIFDCLLEYTFNGNPFFEVIFSMFENESHKIKVRIVHLFLSLAIPQIWQKSVFFFLTKNIITNLFLYIESEVNDTFREEIIKTLIQICSVNFMSSSPEIQSELIKEIQSDIASDVLNNLENEDNGLNELAYSLKSQIESLKVEPNHE